MCWAVSRVQEDVYFSGTPWRGGGGGALSKRAEKQLNQKAGKQMELTSL